MDKEEDEIRKGEYPMYAFRVPLAIMGFGLLLAWPGFLAEMPDYRLAGVGLAIVLVGAVINTFLKRLYIHRDVHSYEESQMPIKIGKVSGYINLKWATYPECTDFFMNGLALIYGGLFISPLIARLVGVSEWYLLLGVGIMASVFLSLQVAMLALYGRSLATLVQRSQEMSARMRELLAQRQLA
jgi:hypothetical protein